MRFSLLSFLVCDEEKKKEEKKEFRATKEAVCIIWMCCVTVFPGIVSRLLRCDF